MVRAAVVRTAADGFAVHFLFGDRHEKVGFQRFLGDAVPREESRVENRALAQGGQALIEFALLLPLLFLLIVNVVNFRAFIFSWITVANAELAGADYLIMGGATVGAPPQRVAAQINNVVTRDISSLLNRATLGVQVCTGATCATSGQAIPAGDPSTPPGDPEVGCTGCVDVTYTFNPPIVAWNFTSL